MVHLFSRLVLFKSSVTAVHWLGFALTSLIYLVCYSGLVRAAGMRLTLLTSTALSSRSVLLLQWLQEARSDRWLTYARTCFCRANILSNWRVGGWGSKLEHWWCDRLLP